MKDRTRELPSDPAPGSESVKAREHRTSSAQRGGKHSEASAETETWLGQVLDATNASGSSCITETRREPKLSDLTGTARCGAACRVVWEG